MLTFDSVYEWNLIFLILTCSQGCQYFWFNPKLSTIVLSPPVGLALNLHLPGLPLSNFGHQHSLNSDFIFCKTTCQDLWVDDLKNQMQAKVELTTYIRWILTNSNRKKILKFWKQRQEETNLGKSNFATSRLNTALVSFLFIKTLVDYKGFTSYALKQCLWELFRSLCLNVTVILQTVKCVWLTPHTA